LGAVGKRALHNENLEGGRKSCSNTHSCRHAAKKKGALKGRKGVSRFVKRMTLRPGGGPRSQ